MIFLDKAEFIVCILYKWIFKIKCTCKDKNLYSEDK